MSGKHSRKRRYQPRRRIPRTIELVDASNLLTHFMTPDALAAGLCLPGDYIVICGQKVLPAALVEPGNGRYCLPCRQTRFEANAKPTRRWTARWKRSIQ
jgi:hypothetical protein